VIEDNFYLVGGMPKRLFDRTSVDAIFEKGWEVVDADERVTRRYGGEKVVWDIAAREADG
jgi:allophanate hydrolase subunit 2